MVKLLGLKMLRDMGRSKAVYIICALVVTIGFSGYSLMSIAYERLMDTRDAFFSATDFSTAFADVEQAPLAVAGRLAAVPGVSVAEGRLTDTARVQALRWHEQSGGKREELLAGEAELLLISTRPEGMNRPYLNAGSLPRAGRLETVLGAGFAAAHGLRPGDAVSLIIGGQATELEVCGIGVSPENIYLVKDLADMLPDLSSYDGAFLHYDTLAALLGREGAANSFAFTLWPGAGIDDVKAAVEDILRPYVCYRVYDRADHVSTAMLQAELDQLQSMAGVIPVLFLLVAAVILYITLFRLVEQQRVQIGALLSLGFSHRAISLHFACFGAATGLLGGVAGGASGILCAVPIWEYYLTFYSMPALGAGFGAAYPYLFYSALAGALFCGAIGWLAARGVARLQPAEALQPAAPPAGKLTPLERLPWTRELLTIPGLVGLRGVFRNGRRSLFSLVGIACAYMMIASLVSMNSMVDIFIYDELTEVEQQDFTVYFNAPVAWADARAAVSHPEVRRAELVLDVGVTCKSPVASLEGTLKGLEVGGELLRLADAAGRPLALAEGGAIITAHMAAALELGPGDWLEVESPGPAGQTMRLPVAGVTGQYMNSTVYVPLRLAAEFQRTNGACNSLLVAGTEQARRDVADRLADAARFTLAEGRLAKIDKMNAAMGSMLFILYYMAFAGVAIGFAVIFTGSLVCFEEMKREMATMITLGLNSRDCLEVISSGQWLLTFGGVILGLPLTWAATEAMVRTMSGDMYTIPNYLSGEALVRATVLTLVAVVLSNAVIHRRLRRITPVDIMRERN